MKDVLVTVKCGTLKGKTELDYANRTYYSFRGIPYAKPPLGILRFKAPLPPDLWNGIWDATKHGEVSCFLRGNGAVIGSENCLFLNVYTRNLGHQIQHPAPVMCWIHGGAFLSGSGNSEWHGPDYLINENVVLVTLNYRLGLLGFLNFEDPALDVPGNAGLKDQVMALRWIRDNIRSFGGDPNNVTIFGFSAGAVSVHYLLLSPLAKGLFHKAIIQSGNAVGCWSTGQRSLCNLQAAMNMKANEKTFLQLLQKMSLAEIMQLQAKIPFTYELGSQPPFGPVVEKFPSRTSFLLEQPRTILQSGVYNHVPIMTGYTSREALSLNSMVDISDKQFNLETFDVELEMPITIKVIKGSEISKHIAEKIKLYYFGNKQGSGENINQYYLLKTDAISIWPAHCTLRYHANSSREPIYFYRISLDANLNVFKKLLKINMPGTAHGDELGYLFKHSKLPSPSPHTPEMTAIKHFTKLWTNFARTGNPNPTKKDPLINVHWKPIDKDKFHYLDIGENLTVGVNPEGDRVAFWDELKSLSLTNSKL